MCCFGPCRFLCRASLTTPTQCVLTVWSVVMTREGQGLVPWSHAWRGREGGREGGRGREGEGEGGGGGRGGREMTLPVKVHGTLSLSFTCIWGMFCSVLEARVRSGKSMASSRSVRVGKNCMASSSRHSVSLKMGSWAEFSGA